MTYYVLLCYAARAELMFYARGAKFNGETGTVIAYVAAARRYNRDARQVVRYAL